MTPSASSLRRLLGSLRDRRAPRIAVVPSGVSQDEPPVFIIGCQRSGTSLLRRIVDSHPRIACPPESTFLLPLTDVLRDEKSIRGLDSMGYGRAEVVRVLRDAAWTFFAGYASSHGKPRWADKTPNYVDCLPELHELFPEARFVLLVRHGLDVVHSLVDGPYRFPAIDRHLAEADGDRRAAAAIFWREQNEKIERFRLQHEAQCLRVRYEDLTARPEPVLREMFGFLGEAWDPAVLEFNRSPHDAGLEDPRVRGSSKIETVAGRWLAWPPDEIARVSAICGPMLATLGYQQAPADALGGA